MSPRLQTLLHLAGVIDLKREKLETALTDARRQQLSSQLRMLTKQYEAEYAELEKTGPSTSQTDFATAAD